MKIPDWIRHKRQDLATKSDLAECAVWLHDKIESIGNKIMADLATASADQDAAITAVKTLVSDLNTKIDAQAADIAQLKSQLSGSLTADQQALVDKIDSGAKDLQSFAADAEAKLNPAPTDGGSSDAGSAPADGSSE
jgi:hypothetical protein